MPLPPKMTLLDVFYELKQVGWTDGIMGVVPPDIDAIEGRLDALNITGPIRDFIRNQFDGTCNYMLTTQNWAGYDLLLP